MMAMLFGNAGAKAEEMALKEQYYLNFQSDYPLEMKYSQTGDHETALLEYEASLDPVHLVSVWYPKTMEASSDRLPMILVVNASNCTAHSYPALFERLASWGFIAVGNDDSQTGTGKSASDTLSFMHRLPDEDVIAAHIDWDRIGLIGYSQGGAGAIHAAIDFENSGEYRALFTGSAAYRAPSVMMGWGDYDVSKISIPYFMTAGTGFSDDTGLDMNESFGGVSPLQSQIENFENLPQGTFKVRGRVTGAEHDQMLAQSDGYMTAWMLYHLCGDLEAGAVFLGEAPEISINTRWQNVEIAQ